MTTNYALNRIQKPHRYYQAPARVIADDKLSEEDKLRVLQTMRHDAILMAKATAENMTGGHTPNLREIELALQDVAGAPEREG